MKATSIWLSPTTLRDTFLHMPYDANLSVVNFCTLGAWGFCRISITALSRALTSSISSLNYKRLPSPSLTVFKTLAVSRAVWSSHRAVSWSFGTKLSNPSKHDNLSRWLASQVACQVACLPNSLAVPRFARLNSSRSCSTLTLQRFRVLDGAEMDAGPWSTPVL